MARYDTESSLLDGATSEDQTPLTVRSVESVVYGDDGEPFPALVEMAGGRLEISADGRVVFDDLDDTSEHPQAGVAQVVGTFTFTVWNGVDESSPETATVRLAGLPDDCALPGIAGAGFCEDEDAGTDGRWFVCASSGDDMNPGTLEQPFATIQHAVDVATAGDIIRLRNQSGGGVYRETVDAGAAAGLPEAPIVISGYGREKPVISGADIVPEWAPCTEADAALVGPSFAEIFKATIPRPTFALDPVVMMPVGSALNIVEDGEQLELVHRQPIDPRDRVDGTGTPVPYHMPMDVSRMYVAQEGSFTTNASDHLLSLSSDVFTRYTADQLRHAFLRHSYVPTEAVCVGIVPTSEDTVTIPLPFPGAVGPSVRFALSNILPEFRVGQWGYVDSGRGDITVYVWPRSIENLDGKIEYTRRTKGIIVHGSTHLHLRHLEISQQGGLQYLQDGRAVDARAGGGTVGVDIYNVRCQMFDMCTLSNRGSIIAATGCDGFRAEKLEVRESRHHIAINSGDTDRLHVLRYKAEHLGASAFRTIGNTNTVLAWADIYDVGYGSHANVGNHYGVGGEDAGPFWMHAVRTRWSRGYFPIKSTNGVYVTCCDLAGSSMDPEALPWVDDRALSLENDSWSLPPDAQIWLVNTRLVPDPRKGDYGTLNATVDTTLLAFNNILHGGTDEIAAFVVDDNSVYTLGTGSGTDNDQASLEDTYADVSEMDYSLLPTSVVRTKEGRALRGATSLQEAIEADFGPLVELLETDLFGRAWDLDAPPVGPTVDFDELR